MNPPHITVLMAVYNGGQYLKRSIQSILDQSFTDFELLIINDKSTDDTLATIESFKDERIQVYINEQNMGQSRSLNKGLNLARGKYVARIDADDFAFPQWLKEQHAFLENNAKYAVISMKAVVIDENDRIRRIYDSPENQKDIILRSFTFSPINHVGCLFNRKTIVDNGGYVEAYKIAADFGLWSNLIRGGHQMTSNKMILVAIRAHSSSLSRSASGAQELEDLSAIMRGNINEFTNTQITDDESMILCRAFFDEANLNDFEFDRALVLLKTVYGSLSQSTGISTKHALQWSKSRRAAAYLKRVFYFIEKEDYVAVKAILRQGVEDLGFFSPLGILFMIHFLGNMTLKTIPALYEKVMTIKATFKTKVKLRMVV